MINDIVSINGLGGSEIFYTTLRVATGAFFLISGYHKLFNKERHATLVKTLKEDGVPFVQFNQWWVPAVEFSAGAAVAVGFLTELAALGLIAICLVACIVDGFKRIREWAPIDAADWVDDMLYLPEFIYILILSYIVCAGPGPYSLSALIVSIL